MDSLIKILEGLGTDSDYGVNMLYQLPPVTQELIITELVKHPQFKNTKSFEFIKHPVYVENGEVVESRTMKLMNQEEIDSLQERTLEMVSKYTIIDGKIKMELVPREVKPKYTMLNEHVKIYSIMVSPTMYSEPSGYNELLVSLLSYNPSTFTPCQRIILSISREKIQDDIAMGKAEIDIKQHLHDLLDKGIEMLENRETNYKITKCIMIKVTPDSYAQEQKN